MKKPHAEAQGREELGGAKRADETAKPAHVTITLEAPERGDGAPARLDDLSKSLLAQSNALGVGGFGELQSFARGLDRGGKVEISHVEHLTTLVVTGQHSQLKDGSTTCKIMDLACEMPKSSAATHAKKLPTVKRAEVMSPLQSRLLGDIERAVKAIDGGKTELQRRGGPSQQVLEKWARGGGMTLRMLEKLADALNTEVVLIIPGVSDPPSSFTDRIGDLMKPHDQELARMIDRMDDGERRELLGYLKGKASSRPHEPDAD